MRFSEQFGLELGDEDDWFDPMLSMDTKLFIDPFLIYADERDEFVGSHDEIVNFFNTIYGYIAGLNGDQNSIRWRRVVDCLVFPEVEELCLGYTGKGTSGAGSGRGFAHLIATALWNAIIAGVIEITHFEEVAILQERIGPDRIGDITSCILRRRLIGYTARIASRYNIPCSKVQYLRGHFDCSALRWIPLAAKLPFNPHNGKHIILVPRRYLRSLPTINPDDFWSYAYDNESERLRREFNTDISSRADRPNIIAFAKKNPDIMLKYVKFVESQDASPYDFRSDPLGLIRWYEVSSAYCRDNSLKTKIDSIDLFVDSIRLFLNQYVNFIENGGGWRLLWNDSGRPRKEEIAQLVLIGIVKNYCAANDIDITKEANIGRGPVDFKVSKGYKLRVLIEVKLARNTKFWNGLTKQLPLYLKAEDVKVGFFVVVVYTDKDAKKLAEINEVIRGLTSLSRFQIETIVVDARHSPMSASKL